MSYNGAGTFVRIYNWVTDKNNGIDITASRMDGDSNDFVNSGFNTAFCRDGQAVATGNFNLGSFRITALGSATAAGDAIRADQIQKQSVTWCGNAGGTADALTLTPSPASAATTVGQRFQFKATATNATTTPTVAISGLTALTIQKNGGVLAASNITSGLWYEVLVDAATTCQLSQLGFGPALSSPISLTSQVTGILPVANGGTGATLSATGGASQVLKQTSVGGVVTVAQLAASDLSNGTTGSGAVLLSAGTAAIASGKTLTVSNTLTFTGTDGVTVPFGTRTRQVFTTGSGTYSTPANTKYIVVRLIGGGGSGQGSGTTAGGGSTGNDTTFSSLTGSGGGSGASSAATGGAATGGDINIPGGSGVGGSTNLNQQGGQGGSGAFGGGGAGGAAVGAQPGKVGATNSGGGGGGASDAGTGNAGGGGAAGGYAEKLITSPAATYSYAVGGASTGGVAGTSGAAGANGAAGIIIVDEFYQ